MSETAIVNIAQRAYNLDISAQFDGYSGVRIYVGADEDGNDIIYRAGNSSGRVLEITNPFGTQEMAIDTLNRIRGYQYQPMTADGALLNPAAEIGDGVSVNGVYTGIFGRDTQFGRLMASTISAPTDEEIAHEYATTSEQDRQYARFVKETRAAITLTASQISAEVSRATAEEGTLRASITANANSISAEVTRATAAEEELSSNITLTASIISAQVAAVNNNKLNHTRTNSSFGWQLTSSGFYLNSNGNNRVFEANSSGIKIMGNAEVTGKITATSGYIGNGSQGFQIRASSIANGKSSLNDNYDGVYIGTDGIALGSKFKVDSFGNVTATSMTAENMKLSGYLMIGDSYIDANTLREGAEYSFYGHDDWDWSTGTVSDGYGGWDWSTSEVYDNGGYWSGGAEAGYDAKYFCDAAGNRWEGVGTLCAGNLIGDTLSVGGWQAVWMSRSVMSSGGYPITIYYLGSWD